MINDAVRRNLPVDFAAGLCLAVFGLLVPLDLEALDPDIAVSEYRIDPWNSAKGLPSNDVTSIAQSRDGYLWIGTEQGLVRFDGKQFNVFDPGNTPELRQYYVNQLLAEDNREGLWIRSRGGALTYRSRTGFKTYGQDDGIQEFALSAMCLNRVNGLWVGTLEGNLYYLYQGSVTRYPGFNGLQGRNIRALAEDSQDRLWIATRDSLMVSELGELQTTPWELSGEPVLFPARTDGVWVGHGSKVSLASVGKWDVFVDLQDEEQTPRVTALYEDVNGVLWVGTRDLGLLRFHHGVREDINAENTYSQDGDTGLQRNHVTAITEDLEGNLWVGTYGGGIHRIKRRIFDVISTSDRRGVGEVRSITPSSEGSVWAGSDGGGLFRIQEGEISRFRREDGLPSDSVWAVLEDRHGVLWVGTEFSGMALFEADGFKPMPAPPGFRSESVRVLYEDPDGDMWVGTADEGLYRFRNYQMADHYHADAEDLEFRLPENVIRAVIRGRDGALWVGTNGRGVCRILPGRPVSNPMVGAPSVTEAQRQIRVLHEDSDGSIWVGTVGGLGRYRHNDRFEFITRKDGLPDDLIYQFFEVEPGRYWVGGNSGVFRLDRRDVDRFLYGGAKSVRAVIYDSSDGLETTGCNGGSQPSGCRTEDGRLWFPTSTLIATIDPANVEINTRPPKVVIERMEVSKAAYNLNGEIRVPPRRDNFIFYFTGLSFSTPGKTRFQYKLEPYDDDWVDAGYIRLAQYENLPPGQYTFRVTATNRDNIENTVGASISFKYLPPFWRTWWFLTLLALGGLFLARYFSFKDLRTKLSSVLREHALEEERVRIAKDMHDDIGASLTEMRLLGELLERNTSDPAQVKALAQRLSDRSRTVSQKIDEIVWAVNPKNDTVDKLAAYLVHYAEDYFEFSPMRCRLDVPTSFPDLAVPSDTRHNIFMIVKEALNNAAKYSEAEDVWLRMALNRGQLLVEVVDNGKGFEAGSPTGNGLDNMRKRAAELNAVLFMESAPGEGTTLRLLVPLR